MRFRKKPVVIEAEQFLPDTLPLPFSGRGDPMCFVDGVWTITTMEGPLHVSNGDWIIKGVKGEWYPIKDDIFKETYDQVG